MSEDIKRVKDASNRLTRILDAKYEPTNLKKLVKNTKRLDKEQSKELFKVLKKYELIFDGTSGKWMTLPHKIYLKDPKVALYHKKVYSMPQAHERGPT